LRPPAATPTASPLAADDARSPVVFTSEAIENIPPARRAREAWRVAGENEFVEVFELAEPGKDFAGFAAGLMSAG
jgi:hypothetical protein